MKKIICFLLIAIFLSILSGCTVSHFVQAKSYLDSGEYEKAIAACEAALESNKNGAPLLLRMDGTGGINADYFSHLCIGISYGMLGDLDKATYSLQKSINFFPDKAFLNYLMLSDLYYKYNRIDEAYQYALKAKKTVGTKSYYKIMEKSVLDKDVWINAVDAAIAFYELRLDYMALEHQLAVRNTSKAMRLAEKILNRKYKVHFSANGNGPELILVNKGGMADLNGLMVGDKILSINNKSLPDEKTCLHELNQLMKQYGKSVMYKIERNGRTIDIEAKLDYPEVEYTRRILQDLRANKTDSYKYIEVADSRGPWIKILEPKTARGVRIVSDQKVSFVVLASGSNKIAKVTVNGVKCRGSAADTLEKTFLLEPKNIRKYMADLPLKQGKNSFIVQAVDTQGNEVKKILEIDGNQTYSKNLAKIYDRKVAVIIGINKYMSSEYETLSFAVKDAQSVKARVVKMGFDKIIEIPENKATKGGILRVLADDLPYALGQNDALFVFFAGHGDVEELKNGDKEGYILPVDAKKKNYRGTAISMEKIHDVIKRYKAKHILLAFDSCNSGYGAINRSASKTLYEHDAVQVITAGGKNEAALEDMKAGHGIFTKSFLNALSNESLYNSDGIVIASDIGQYVKKEVSKQTDGKQNPLFRVIEGEGDFAFKIYE